MKTHAFIAVATVLLVVMYVLVMRIQTDVYRDMANIIPSSALVYIEQRDGLAALRKFTGSSFWQKFQSIDFSGVANEIGVQIESIATINNLVSFITSAQDDLLFKELFGRKFALAVLPPLSSPDLADFLQENLVVVVDPENPQNMLVNLASDSKRFVDNIAITSGQYGKHRIQRVATSNRTLFLVTLNGFSVISRNERQLRRCIDTFDGELQAISLNGDFHTVKKNFGTAECFFYMPIPNIREFLISLFADKKNLLEKLDLTTGFSAFGYGREGHAAGVKEKIIVRYDRANIDNLAGNELDIPPIKGSMFSLTTPNPMVYHWSNFFYLQRFFTYLANAAETNANLLIFLHRLETASGTSVEQLPGRFGNESSVIVEAGSGNSLFPFPLGLIFVRVAEKADLRDALQELLATYEISMQQDEYGQAKYVYWSLSPQDGLRPLYGFWHDLFFFGNSETLLHRVIDTNSRALSLLDNGTVQKIDPGLALENNSVTYSNNVQLIDTIKNILNVMGTFAAIEDREMAMKARLVISKIINPLLDGAKMYGASVTRSYFTPELIVIESITNISDSL